MRRASGGTIELLLSWVPCGSGRPEEADTLWREGWDVNAKRIYRLYKEMGLQLRQKPPKRRVKGEAERGSLRGIVFE